jgi:ribosomal protein S18 acetylase RimI-like enzyme
MERTVLLKDIVDALELASDETSSYVNRTTGEVVTLSHEDLGLAEAEPNADMPEWQQEVAAEAKRILESDDWLELPTKADIHEWQIMKDFAASWTVASERTAVNDAIHGSGAFRNFKSTIRRLGIEAAWFAYKTAALETIARDWLERHGPLPNPAPSADDQLGRSAPPPALRAADLAIKVRPFVLAERDQVERLWSRVFPDDPPYNAPGVMVDTKLRVQPELFLVALANDDLVGAVMAGFDGVRGWLYHLAVSPEHRRRGVATALVRAAETRLSALGCPKVNLQVRATNQEVIAFYRRLGYSVEERVSMGRRLGGSG